MKTAQMTLTTQKTHNHYLNVADVAFHAAEVIEGFDYVAFGENVINISATIAAVIVGVMTYVITAFQLFWLEHGEVILTRTFQFTTTLIDTCGAVYYAGVNSRPAVNYWTARVTDNVFYALAA